MPRRCRDIKKCPYPRTRWWKSAMGVDWYGGSGGSTPEPILFGSTTILWGDTEITFED